MALMPPRLTPAEYYALPPFLRAHYVCVDADGLPIYYMLVFSFGLQYQQEYPEPERAAPAATVTGSGEIQRSVVALALFENLDDEPLED